MSTEASLNETRLPRAVREQMLRVNQRIEARNQPRQEQTPAAEGESAPASAATEPDTPNAAAPAAAPSAPASPAQGAADPRENDPAYWRQRFNVTQGMLRSFQERQAAENAERDRELTELREKIRTLEAKDRSTNQSKLDLKLFFSEEQIEHFGEDQCEAMARAAMAAAGQQAQAVIEAEVRPIRERSEAQAKQAAADKEAEFWEKLAELMPDYPEINARQDWLDWLPGIDDATGLVRQDILDRHRRALNAAGVAKVFKTFKETLKRPTPPVAAPRSAAAGAGEITPPTPTKGYPTPGEIKDFYKRAAIGRVSDKERVEFEARLKLKHAA